MSTEMNTDYSPSWFTRFTSIVDNLRLPFWLFYLLLAFLLSLAAIFVWVIGTSIPGGKIEPIVFVTMGTISYALFFMHYLDRAALDLLFDIKKILKPEIADRYDLEKLLSVLPRKTTNLVTAAFLLIIPGGFLLGFLTGVGTGSEVPVPGGLFGLFAFVFFALLWSVNGTLVYHTWRQLRVVRFMLSNLVEIHPFHQKELFAFSRFTARTAILLVISNPLWVIFDPGPSSLIISSAFTVLALVVFIWPLIGTHRKLVNEKDSMLDSNSRQMETIIDSIEKTIAAKSNTPITQLSEQLSALEMARTRIEKISTWPWKFETLRQLTVAVIIPLVVWLFQTTYLKSYRKESICEWRTQE